MDETTVFVEYTKDSMYPEDPPYNPAQLFPEYPFKDLGSNNTVYSSVRDLLISMKLDVDNIGKPTWNPLGEFLKAGDTVLLKPNLVSHFNWGKSEGNNDTLSLVTHGSIIRAVCDYAFLAVGKMGRVILADSPVLATRWDEVISLVGLKEIKEFYAINSFNLELIDLRLAEEDFGVLGGREVKGKTNGIEYVEVDLAGNSLLHEIIDDWKKFAVSSYDFKRMRQVHNPNRNAYLFPKILFEADLVINLPKLKFHQKAGITVALKNFVGVIGHKDYLPHYRLGNPAQGGDEYPDWWNPLPKYYWTLIHSIWNASSPPIQIVAKFITRVLRLFMPRDIVRQGHGGWYGNDTLWRTVLDINRCYFYYDTKNRSFASRRRTNYLCFVDGIVVGQEESPLSPTPLRAGYLIAGLHPVAIDVTAASLIQLDYLKIPQLTNAFLNYPYPLATFTAEDIEVVSKCRSVNLSRLQTLIPTVSAKPSVGWASHIELKEHE